MEMNDNTILRIKVPARLYESVKAQLTLKEGKNDYGMPGAKTIKEKKTSDGSKKTKTKAPVRVHSGKSKGDNIPNADKGIPGMGMTKKKKSPKKKLGLEELHAIMEILQDQINEMEDQQEKKPVEEALDMAATTDIADMIKSALKAGKKVTVTSKKDKEGKGNDPASDPEPPKPKEIEGIQSGRIKVKHTGPRNPITGGSGLPDIDLSDVESLVIDGESVKLPAQNLQEPEQDVSQKLNLTRQIPDRYRGTQTAAGFRTGD